MDRHNNLHKASRVELPASLQWLFDNTDPESPMSLEPGSQRRPNLSKSGELIARIGVLTCSLAVIATASLLALLLS
jgi:hypothetical protein